MAACTSLAIGDGQKVFPHIGQILARTDIAPEIKYKAVAIGFQELDDLWHEDIRKLRDEKHSLEEQIRKAHEQRTGLEARVNLLGTDNDALKSQIADLERSIAEKNVQLNEINQKLTLLDANLAAKQAEIAQLNEKMQKAKADAEAAAAQKERELKAANDRIDEVLRKAKEAEAAAAQREKDLKAANDKIDQIRKKAEEEAKAQERRIKAVEEQNAIAAAAEQKRLEQCRVDRIAAIRSELVNSKDQAWSAFNSPAKRLWASLTASSCDKVRAYIYSLLLLRCFDKYVGDNPGCKPDDALENANRKAKSINLRVESLELPDVFINGERCSCFSPKDFPAIT